MSEVGACNGRGQRFYFTDNCLQIMEAFYFRCSIVNTGTILMEFLLKYGQLSCC